MPYFALSVTQPWAWLIVNGYKDVENRKWYTNHRGELYIHAPKKIDWLAHEYLKKKYPNIQFPATYEVGQIVGVVDMYGCSVKNESEWFEGPYGFLLRNPRRFSNIFCKGALKIFAITDKEVITRLDETKIDFHELVRRELFS